MNFKSWAKTATFFLSPLLVLASTSSPVSSKYSLHVALILFVASIAFNFNKSTKYQVTRTVIHTLMILFLVGGTGWFLSPFFFLLYLLPLYLGFLYAPIVAFGLLTALLIIFAFSVGEVDPAFDTMTLLSLLLVIPLVIYLRKKYLIVRQTTKDILILEDESGIGDADTISHLLSNRVTNLGVTIRQPLTFIKQAATVLLEEDLDAKEATKYITRIRTTAAEALNQVKSFEHDTSANKVLTNKNEKTLTQPN